MLKLGLIYYKNTLIRMKYQFDKYRDLAYHKPYLQALSLLYGLANQRKKFEQYLLQLP